MTETLQNTWEEYVLSWKIESKELKQEQFARCLAPTCEYNDPLATTKGWDELCQYMLDFHEQVPGGHFVTTYFLAHHQKSIAKWEMRTGDDTTIGEGISYGQYNDQGKIVAMTGFFETP